MSIANTPAEARRAVRDLDDDEFLAAYECDRFTASVLASKYSYLAQHMCSHMLTNAFSPILRDWYDFAATYSGPPELGYPMTAVSNSIASFLGTMGDAVRNMVTEYGPDNLRPGDVLIANDPYRIGTHVNDTCFVRPVFHNGVIVGFINLQAHMIDMGGVVPYGFGIKKQNVYENGLSLPPMLLYRDDEPIRSTFSLILDNVRMGSVILPDILSIYRNLQLGERLLLEIVDRYGVGAHLGATRYAADRSAEVMAAAIERLPDGTYYGEDLIDCDGIDATREYRVAATVRVAGTHMEVDLSGTSEQARTCINAGPYDAKTGVVVALKFLIDPATPLTSGALRNVDIVVPPGTTLSAEPPNGAIFTYYEQSGGLVLAIMRALAKALGPDAVAGDYCSPSVHNGYGVLADGTPWGTSAQCGGEHGPWGATKDGDADSSNAMYLGNSIAPAVEAIEADVPVVILAREYATDSSGPGTHRGGASVRKDSLWLTPGEHNTMPLHVKTPSGFGVHGGGDGVTGAVWLWPSVAGEIPDFVGTDRTAYERSTPIAGRLDGQSNEPSADGEYLYFAEQPSWQVGPGAVFRYLTNGGGGWGDPLARDPECVLRDVRDEYVSVEAALAVYGVVVLGDVERDPEGLTVDAEATRAERTGQ